jgi:bifunctional non-homologous end joining protein LigD
MLPDVTPIAPQEIKIPFDHAEWIFELKFDGFRALAYIQNGECRLVSRKQHTYTRFADLRAAIPGDINAVDAILDGEIVVLDPTGKPRFTEIMRSGAGHAFAAFDLLWLNGEDLREQPLIHRKRQLKSSITTKEKRRVLYVDHVKQKGRKLFETVCKMDLEGVVAKPMISPYRLIEGRSPWMKIRNPKYTQKEGRGELFHRRK